MVCRSVWAVVPTIDPDARSVLKLPLPLDVDRPRGVEVKLQLVQTETYLGQLRAVQERQIQIYRDAVHARARLCPKLELSGHSADCQQSVVQLTRGVRTLKPSN